MPKEFSELDQRPGKHVVLTPLAEGELEDLMRRALDLGVEIETQEQVKKTVAARINEELKPVKAEYQHLLQVYSDKGMFEESDVIVGFDWEAGEKWFLTEDGRVVGPEPIEEEDRQAPLPKIADVARFKPKEVVQEPEPEPEGIPMCPVCLGTECSCDPESVIDCIRCGMPTVRSAANIEGVCFACLQKGGVVEK